MIEETEEDLAAREQMLNAVERRFWENQNRILKGRPELPHAACDSDTQAKPGDAKLGSASGE